MKVLHVDDSSEDRELIRYRLQKLDTELEIEWAECVESALELAETGRYDCILSDYQMPEINGLSFLKKLRETGNNTPFIFLTGQGNEGVAANAFKAGANDYYTKELELSHYERVINSIKNLATAHHYINTTRKFRQQLDETNEKFQVFTEASKDGLLMHRNGNITQVNSALSKMLGIPKYQLANKKTLDFFPLEEQIKVDQIIKTDIAELYQTNVIRGDGTSFHAEIQGKQIDAGEKTYKLMIIRDIEERTSLQNQLDLANSLLKNLMGLISNTANHLKKPSRILDSYCQVFGHNDQQARNQQLEVLIPGIANLSHSLSNLTQDLTEYEMIASRDLKRAQVNLSQIVNQVIEELNSSAKPKAINEQVENNIQTTADPHLITLALRYLLDNALKFCHRHNAIELGFGRMFMDKKEIFFISDNGLGFDSRHDRHIYQPFVQLHNKQLFQGIGLGLTKAKLILQKHGGKIWAESRPNNGATFYFTLSK